MGAQSRVFWGIMLSFALAGGAIHSSAAMPARAIDENPSWAAVEAARDDAVATTRQLALIDDALTALETRSAAFGDAAVEASAMAEATKLALDDALADGVSIVEQREDAEVELERASVQLGRITAATYRSGSGGLAVRILLNNNPDENLLYQLSVTAQLGSAARDLRERATTQTNLMQSLEKQADEVTRESERLAILAEEEADHAANAQKGADKELARQERRSDELFAQLAVLKNTSADLERGYRAKRTAEVAYEEQQELAAAGVQKPTTDSDANDSSGGKDSAVNDSTGANPSQTPTKPKPTTTPTRTPAPEPTPTPTSTPTPKPTPPVTPPVTVVVDRAAAQAYAAGAVSARGWAVSEYNCLLWLWNHESGWRADAHNPYSGAYGIPQSLPGNKMASAGGDWRTNAATQIDWGLGYISDRYDAPCGAWAHFEARNWY